MRDGGDSFGREEDLFFRRNVALVIDSTRKVIRDRRLPSRAVAKLKVEVRKFFHPTSLSRGKDLFVFEIIEVIVIGEDNDGILGSDQPMSLRFERTNDCEELAVVSVVTCFGIGESFGVTSDRTLFSIFVQL